MKKIFLGNEESTTAKVTQQVLQYAQKQVQYLLVQKMHKLDLGLLRILRTHFTIQNFTYCFIRHVCIL